MKLIYSPVVKNYYKMKYTISIIRYSCLLAICFLFSCDSKLDIEPQESISPEVALSTDQGVKSALIGAYNYLSNGILWGGGGFLMELYAASGDIVYTGPFKGLKEIFAKEIPVQNGFVEWKWSTSYSTINQCNAIIESISNVIEEDRAQIEAEAKFIRAAAYFELINSFAKTWVDGDPNTNLGVPLVTVSTKSLKDLEVPRATVSEIYELILSDLDFSKNNLSRDNGSRAATFAASALLSRVYLMQENYAAAKVEAESVIGSERFSLLDDYASAFNQSNNTDEDIFTIEVTSQDGVNNYINYYAGTNAGGDGAITINDNHVARYDSIDQRGQLFYFDNIDVRRTGKWQDNANKDGNINIIRLSEMYLTRAECRFRENDVQGTAEDINFLRKRAGVPLLNAFDITLDDILKERYLELCFEGLIFQDIKRAKRSFGNIPFDADRMVFPIPQREMDVNNLLVQNPGY